MLLSAIRRGWRQLTGRRIYLCTMILVPLGFTLFLVSLMSEGLPLQVPMAVVDLDNSQMSRSLTRNLGSTELIDVKYRLDSYLDALDRTRRGEIFGFFIIPVDFQKDAIAGNGPSLTFYSNLTYYVPGTLAYKGLKTTAVTTSGGIVKTRLTSLGVSDAQAGDLLQPVATQEHGLGNPWTNYSIYLTNSFAPGMLALMIMLVTCFSICDEIKRGSARDWIESAGGNIVTALAGKLIPQAVIFCIVGIGIQALLYGWLHFPMHCPAWHMILGMVLMVFACQAFALLVVCVVPNLRMSVSTVSLIGILTFSVAAISFPVPNMYGGVAIFSYILPFRYYFLIYADQALNGLALFYSRWWYVALLAFLLLPWPLLPRLRRRCMHNIYIP